MNYGPLKKQLEERRAEILAHHDSQEEFETTELSNYDNHPADNATDLTDSIFAVLISCVTGSSASLLTIISFKLFNTGYLIPVI